SCVVNSALSQVCPASLMGTPSLHNADCAAPTCGNIPAAPSAIAPSIFASRLMAASKCKTPCYRAWRLVLLRELALRQSLLQRDFHVYTCGQVQTHQGINSLVCGIHNVHQTLVSAHFELVARGLVHVR